MTSPMRVSTGLSPPERELVRMPTWMGDDVWFQPDILVIASPPYGMGKKLADELSRCSAFEFLADNRKRLEKIEDLNSYLREAGAWTCSDYYVRKYHNRLRTICADRLDRARAAPLILSARLPTRKTRQEFIRRLDERTKQRGFVIFLEYEPETIRDRIRPNPKFTLAAFDAFHASVEKPEPYGPSKTRTDEPIVWATEEPGVISARTNGLSPEQLADAIFRSALAPILRTRA